MPEEDYVRLKEALIEFIPVGNSVKVCAIDPKTGVEVSIIGPKAIGTTELKRNAIAKLIYVLKKKQREQRR